MNTNTISNNTTDSNAVFINKLAADVNLFNQLVFFIGMAAANGVIPTVQLTLGNSQRTNIFLNASHVLVSLTQQAEELETSLQERGIDTDELTTMISQQIQLARTQKGG